MKTPERTQSTIEILERSAHEHGLPAAPRIIVADDEELERRRIQSLLHAMGLTSWKPRPGASSLMRWQHRSQTLTTSRRWQE